jgi:hypothetical protein
MMADPVAKNAFSNVLRGMWPSYAGFALAELRCRWEGVTSAGNGHGRRVERFQQARIDEVTRDMCGGTNHGCQST